MKECHIVHYFESERGWGTDEWVREFDTYQEALDEVQSVNQDYAVFGDKTPDYYIIATYKGVKNKDE